MIQNKITVDTADKFCLFLYTPIPFKLATLGLKFKIIVPTGFFTCPRLYLKEQNIKDVF